MKKLNCLLVLAFVCTGFVFSQEGTGTRKNAITMDLMTLLKGFIASDSNSDTVFGCMAFAYERLIFPRFSVGAEVDLYPGTLINKNFLFFGFAAAARYYPMSEYMKKLFIGTFLGFNLLSTDGKLDVENGDFIGMFAGLRAGYKLPVTNMFFIEPSMSYSYSKTNFGYMGLIPHNFGWQASLRAGISF